MNIKADKCLNYSSLILILSIDQNDLILQIHYQKDQIIGPQK